MTAKSKRKGIGKTLLRILKFLLRILIIAFWILLGIFLVFGVPVIIYKVYQIDPLPKILTLWSAETVLSYYGSVLAAIITGVSLFLTIRFTKKQIQRESYIKSETEKWAKIEDAVSNILNEINPMPILKQEMAAGFTDSFKSLTLFQKYQIDCKIATDHLMTCVNTADFVNIAELVTHVTNVASKLLPISQKKIDQYNKLEKLKRRKSTEDMLKAARNRPGFLSPEKIAEHQRFLEETKDIRFEDIEDSMKQINKEFVDIYNDDFRALLQHKGATFEIINMQIQENANTILSVGGKNHAHP